jgi:hypothetical protein
MKTTLPEPLSLPWKLKPVSWAQSGSETLADGRQRFWVKEDLLGITVMATWDIRSKNGHFLLPDHAFPLATNSMERQGGRVPLALSKKKSSHPRKTGAFRQHGLREAVRIQHTRSSWRLWTRDRLIASVFPALGHVLVVMVQPS